MDRIDSRMGGRPHAAPALRPMAHADGVVVRGHERGHEASRDGLDVVRGQTIHRMGSLPPAPGIGAQQLTADEAVP
jgi:hypothetical protein